MSDAPAARATMVETHVSVLVCVGDRAVKLKKPVRLPFVDLSTREARERLCHREVELNRRLAPDVYLGVADVVGPDGTVADHLVVMRRMPEERRLSTLVASGTDVRAHLRAVAHRVATFHLAAATSEAVAEAASRDAVAAMWAANTAEMRGFIGDPLDGAAVDAVERLAGDYLRGRGPLFVARVAGGWARDGHGDLLADDIYCLDDGPRILDCIEFADRLRHGDMLLDAAFLAMDLERLGRPDLASVFLDAWARDTGERHPASLADHYVAYRAQVRAKVACIRHRQGDAGAAAQARSLLEMCRSHLERARVRLVLVGGLPGTGKSTLARALTDTAGWTLLRTDEVRLDTAAGATPRYDDAARTAVYDETLRRAERLLELGETVVVDATWLDPAHRAAAAATARRSAADLVAVRCEAPVEVAMARITTRAEVGSDPSDATPQLLQRLAATTRPWPDAVTIDTGHGVDDAVAAALEATGAVAGAPWSAPSPTPQEA